MPTFNSIDVETANADRASMCRIGIVHVRDGRIQDQRWTLVNPEAWPDRWNTMIHGMDDSAVRHGPALPAVRDELRTRLRGTVRVTRASSSKLMVP